MSTPQRNTSQVATPPTRGRRRARWAVPVAVAATALGATLLGPVMADAAPALPPRTAGELLASIGGADDVPLSGTVVHTARLGLPELPEAGGDSISLMSLASGSRTARIWYGDRDTVRVALIGNLAETDVVRNGSDLWLWTSGKNTAQHVRVPAGNRVAETVEESVSPQAAAQRALSAIDPTTAVTVDGTASVAGRPVYELVLRPRDDRTLVGQVRLAVDSVTSVPLRVQVYARSGGAPAIETAFRSVAFATPDPAVFRFRPPPGAKVTELGTLPEGRADKGAARSPRTERESTAPKVIGTGWTSVLAISGVDTSALTRTGRGSAPELSSLVRGMTPVTGSFGSGRALNTKLVSVLLLDDGRLFVGAVRPDVLAAAAAR